MQDARTERLVRAMARQAAVRSGKRLGQEEMLSLINQLFSCSNANYTPGGRAVYSIVGMDQLDSFFNKS